jgi:hypothetical protein
MRLIRQDRNETACRFSGNVFSRCSGHCILRQFNKMSAADSILDHEVPLADSISWTKAESSRQAILLPVHA